MHLVSLEIGGPYPSFYSNTTWLVCACLCCFCRPLQMVIHSTEPCEPFWRTLREVHLLCGSAVALSSARSSCNSCLKLFFVIDLVMLQLSCLFFCCVFTEAKRMLRNNLVRVQGVPCARRPGLGWIWFLCSTFLPSCLTTSAKFPSAQAELGSQWNTRNPSQWNPVYEDMGRPV